MGGRALNRLDRFVWNVSIAPMLAGDEAGDVVAGPEIGRRNWNGGGGAIIECHDEANECIRGAAMYHSYGPFVIGRLLLV